MHSAVLGMMVVLLSLVGTGALLLTAYFNYILLQTKQSVDLNEKKLDRLLECVEKATIEGIVRGIEAEKARQAVQDSENNKPKEG